MIGRVATFTNHNLLTNQALGQASNIVDLRNQASSGYKSRDYAGIASEAQGLLSFENNLNRLEQYNRNGVQTSLRLKSMETAVSNILELATDMQTQILSATNADQADEAAINISARSALEQLEVLLNTKLDGRYLFGGSDTGSSAVNFDNIVLPETQMSERSVGDGTATLASLGVTAPGGTLDINGTLIPYTDAQDVQTLVNDINAAGAGATATLRQDPEGGEVKLVIEATGGGPLAIADIGNLQTSLSMVSAPNPAADYAYYEGNQQKLSARLNEEFTIEYGINADESAFEELIRGLKIAAETGNPASLNVALGHVKNAIKSLTDVQTSIGVDLHNTENVQSQNTDLKLFYEEAVTSFEAADIPSTIAILAQYETSLQASYMVLNKSTQLSLTDYLR
ncbi:MULTISPECIES: hypothetical protein [Thalassospira]|uniref:Flagellar hook-associated protein FlgL n=2 Tax=Thalassospira TaxID=168934 RepID=A0AB72U9J2_9PROT|nr:MULTISPECIES: hypothetical protein [Thalassospira]AJD50886.1 flagellar hook-associated protein FlgL [Thalassospira xiamenensis M-5 = DSM 17429]KEO56598.1 hypothetical protein SMB34_19070 [Thalassospira permensis NBRC 106175]SIT32885.1 flagellar hook-associated protein 3 FlgL [Thalassospira xiamenensis M-5 = DSM 17429]